MNIIFVISLLIALIILLGYPLSRTFKYKKGKFKYRKQTKMLIGVNLLAGIGYLVFIGSSSFGYVWGNVRSMYYIFELIVPALVLPIFSYLYWKKFEKHKKVNILLLVLNVCLLVGFILGVIGFLVIRHILLKIGF
jgi:hypothetical protein